MAKSKTAENAKLQYEAGQTLVAMATMTDSGDHAIFSGASSPWSNKTGFVPKVIPNGVITGGGITPSVGNDSVEVAALTCYLAGVLTSVGASAKAIVRGAVGDKFSISSITVDSTGALVVIDGTDGDAFSETRAAIGGPPLIPVGSIEIGQVRTSNDVAAVILASEIFQVAGQHVERYDYPVWDENFADGKVTFASVLPLIHTGTLPKRVYAEFYTPIFADVSLASDFAPPEKSFSSSSSQIYGGTISKTAESLGQGKFTAYLADGITDPLMAQNGQILWFKFLPDRYKTPYMLVQGKLGIARTFPSADSISAACTISADSIGKGVA